MKTDELVVRRRRSRMTPMKRRIGAAAAAGAGAAPPVDFPGIDFEEKGDRRGRFLGAGLAALIHFGLLGALILLAALNPEIAEEFIELQLLKEPPAKKTDPAPARRVVAERRSSNFAPQAQALKADVVNPKVVARRASHSTDTLRVEAPSAVVAPRKVTRARVVTQRVTAVATVGMVDRTDVEVANDAAAPTLRKASVTGPTGPSVGPRQIVAKGDTIGTGPSMIIGLGDTSSVRDGIDSDRDVLGSRTGPRLASVNTAIGDGMMDGAGGTGRGGVAAGDCYKLPEVQRYLEAVRVRTLARWQLPASVPANMSVTLKFKIDPAGSATRVDVVAAANRALGQSAVNALTSASPFPAMAGRGRCLAREPIMATFRNPVGSG
ncbi:MAG: TonB C-terminal domain-containing protein [Deltaproteobacteria bacterium]|nr:TonB C-terminal domain-containing protein [Deltaproteobacteria bacterium]MBW2447194.1 TonB C-terminal domain-containing protein [Deltaproteobacteria bacterium]